MMGEVSDARLEWLETAALKPHPLNWRTHPAGQKSAMAEVLDRVGWAGAVVVNAVTGHILDGHLRWELATERGERVVPCYVVERTAEQERVVLGTFDSLAEWAEADAGAFAALRSEVESDFGDLAAEVGAMFAQTQQEAAKASHAEAARPAEVGGYWVSVTCADVKTQETVYQLMTGEGREVRVLTL